jgi:hypothetical protein
MTVVDISHVATRSAPSDRSACLDALRGRVRLLARRRLAWVEHLRAKAARPASTVKGRALEAELLVDELDTIETEREFQASNPEIQALNRELAGYERELAGSSDSRLAWLCRTLRLADEERDLIEACVALALEPALARVFAHLHGDRAHAYLSEGLVARLFGRELPLLGEDGALLRWQLVEVDRGAASDPSPIRLDPHILGFVCDKSAWDPAVARVASEIATVAPLSDWPVAALVQRIERAWSHGSPVRVVVTGPRAGGRRSFAACVARALGQDAIALDTSAIADADLSNVHLRAQRQGVLFGQCPVWCVDGGERKMPRAPGVVPLEFVVGEQDVVVGASPFAADEHVTLPPLPVAERRELWSRFVPESRAWPDADLDHLAERYRVQVGDIVAVARGGIGSAQEACEQCRKLTRGRLGELGQHLDCPFGRDDLLLPAELNRALDDFLFEARDRTRFWEQASPRRLFPRGRGLIALMTGTPGTGKTMAAQVIAAELGLDLFRVDLASSVSKYIGETAKNLRKIFLRAAEMNAVLLFDEADALFTKRTEVRDAHDRYANTDTNYLLQLLESFEGIALLASNKKHNMDPAFVRRIRYVMEFPRPSADERRRIWRQLARELSGPEREAALGPALDAVAIALELSGAQIKLSLLSALFAARQARAPLALEHVYRGIDHELAKEGRSVGPKEKERIQQALK